MPVYLFEEHKMISGWRARQISPTLPLQVIATVRNITRTIIRYTRAWITNGITKWYYDKCHENRVIIGKLEGGRELLTVLPSLVGRIRGAFQLCATTQTSRLRHRRRSRRVVLARWRGHLHNRRFEYERKNGLEIRRYIYIWEKHDRSSASTSSRIFDEALAFPCCRRRRRRRHRQPSIVVAGALPTPSTG